MNDFSLEWLLKLRKSELNNLEIELVNINNKISEKVNEQKKNNEFLTELNIELKKLSNSQTVFSTIRLISLCEKKKLQLNEEIMFLQKEKDMIYTKYKDKDKNVHLLKKVKDSYIDEVKQEKARKEQAEINEISIIKRKDDDS